MYYFISGTVLKLQVADRRPPKHVVFTHSVLNNKQIERIEVENTTSEPYTFDTSLFETSRPQHLSEIVFINVDVDM